MTEKRESLRADAINIWRSGLNAVNSETLVRNAIKVKSGEVSVAGKRFKLNSLGRICVVGAGKAGAGMASGAEKGLADLLDRTSGWVNIPEGTSRQVKKIRLHPARPAGINEPTEAGVHGTRKILEMVSGLSENDLCICLLSGGGSALLPLPKPGFSLDDKLQITRRLSESGASIHQMNALRSLMSEVKAGGLARACQAGTLITLVISDVIGDDLNVIASGPTVTETRDVDVHAILDAFEFPPDIREKLNREMERTTTAPIQEGPSRRLKNVRNVILGSNQTAVDAAVASAKRKGYSIVEMPPEAPNTTAEEVGIELAKRMMMPHNYPTCIVRGGEPIVRLVAKQLRGRGGRNQQLVLAAMMELGQAPVLPDFALISGGTDGEDGPTDAAGAVIDQALLDSIVQSWRDPKEYLRRNDAYNFFAPLDGLFFTGPTNTNVCDLRVAVVT